MTIWCVNTVNCEHFHGVYGVYSNLAIAGNAAMQCFRNIQHINNLYSDNYLTCECVPESWGYSIMMYEHNTETGLAAFFGTVEIGEMHVDE